MKKMMNKVKKLQKAEYLEQEIKSEEEIIVDIREGIVEKTIENEDRVVGMLEKYQHADPTSLLNPQIKDFLTDSLLDQNLVKEFFAFS